MKTVCPHCNEEYEVPDNYLQQEAECSMCCKTFTITQTKYCSKCGMPNPMQAFFCGSCQAPFNPITPIPEKKEISEPKKRSSSADSLGTFTYICFWIFALCYVGAAYGIIGSCIWILGRCFSLNFWLFIVSIFLIIFDAILIVTFYVIVSMTTMVTKSHIKVYWTPLRKVAIWLNFVCVIVGTLVGIIAFFVSGGDFMPIVIGTFSIFMSIKLMKLFNIREKEDIDFVESAEDKLKQKRREKIFLLILIGLILFTIICWFCGLWIPG